MISGQNIGIFGWKTRDFRAKAFFSKRILAGGAPRMRGFAITLRMRGLALRVFSGRQRKIFWGNGVFLK